MLPVIIRFGRHVPTLCQFVRAVNYADVVAAGIRCVNLVRDRIRGNGDWVLRLRVGQRGRGVCFAINDRNAAGIAGLGIACVRDIDEARLRIHGHARGRSPNRSLP